MTSQSQPSGSPTRALVLGGGGAVGVGWQVGILRGLQDAGVDFTGAEEILGTSAGALVGALVSGGRDVTNALTALGTLAKSIDPDALAAGNDAFLSARSRASLDAEPGQWVREIGRTALSADTIAQDSYLGLFEILEGIAWPAGFRCTAIDAETGELVVFGPESGVPLRDAVASSCALPALFPPVTINGRPYMDGGIISDLNATSVASTDVVVVLSCHSLESPDAEDHDASITSLATADAELAQLRETTRLIAVGPDFGEMNITADQMMDPNVAAQAVRVGQLQAGREAAAILATWNL